jgi:Mg-chelatase subunit ChlI
MPLLRAKRRAIRQGSPAGATAKSASPVTNRGCASARFGHFSLPKKQASAISETFISATDIAELDGRNAVTYEDIEAAIRLDFPAVEEDASVPSAPAVQPQCRRSARSISVHPVRTSTIGSRSRQPGAITA